MKRAADNAKQAKKAQEPKKKARKEVVSASDEEESLDTVQRAWNRAHPPQPVTDGQPMEVDEAPVIADPQEKMAYVEVGKQQGAPMESTTSEGPDANGIVKTGGISSSQLLATKPQIANHPTPMVFILPKKRLPTMEEHLASPTTPITATATPTPGAPKKKKTVSRIAVTPSMIQSRPLLTWNSTTGILENSLLTDRPAPDMIALLIGAMRRDLTSYQATHNHVLSMTERHTLLRMCKDILSLGDAFEEMRAQDIWK